MIPPLSYSLPQRDLGYSDVEGKHTPGNPGRLGRVHTPEMGVRLGSAAAVAGVVLASLLAGCNDQPAPQPVAGGATPAQLFDHPPYWPGYQWTVNGTGVGWQVAASAAGPEHCDMQAMTFLTIGWPIGTFSPSSAHSREFVRDPSHSPLFAGRLLSTLDLHARLPSDARPTGLSYDGVQVYVSAADAGRDIYVAGGGAVERWPRSDPPILCA